MRYLKAGLFEVLFLLLAFSAFCAEAPPIDKADLDVIYISREPRYLLLHGKVKYVDMNKPILSDPEKYGRIEKFFPTIGEKVTFTAHFTKKGKHIEGEVNYVWKIDGKEVAQGKADIPEYNKVNDASFDWVWQEGEHTVTFEIDADKKIDDFSRVNNSKTDRTDSLGFLFFCRRDAYDKWNSKPNMLGTYSFEDWMNWHFDEMNRQFAEAKYPSCPDGCIERVHVAKFVVVYDPKQFAETDHFGYSGFWDFRETGGPVDKPDGGLIHELGHQLGLIDQYAIVFPLFNNRLLTKYGEPVMKGYEFFQPNTNMQNPGAFKWSELSAAALNRQKGYPRGYFGTYLFDHADEYSIRVLDRAGNPLPKAKVTYYRSVSGLEKQQEGITDANGILKLNNDNTEKYQIPYSPFMLKPTPFGKINILGNFSVLCFHVVADNQEDFVMTEAAWFLVNYWRTGKSHTKVDIKTSIGPAGELEPPSAIKAEWAQGMKIRISWSPVESKNPVKYNVYRSHLGTAWGAYMVGPELIAKEVEQTSFEAQPNGELMSFHITSINDKGIEGGISREVWVPFPRRLNEPVNIFYDESNDRIIMSSGERIHSWSEKRGFFPISFWNIGLRGLAINNDGNFYNIVGNVIHVIDMSGSTPELPIMIYGDKEGGVKFNKPMDVAVDGRDNLVIADTGNGRIVVLSKSGKVISIIGGEGENDDKFIEPVSVAIQPMGIIIAGDAKLKKLVATRITNKDDAIFELIGLPDLKSIPADLLFDSEGRLILVDAGTKAVYRIHPKDFVGRTDTLDKYEKLAGDFINPTSAAIMPNGTLMVYDCGREGMSAFVKVEGVLAKDETYYLQSLTKEKAGDYTCVPNDIWRDYAPTIKREEWHIVGPFPNDNMAGFDTEYPPEKETSFDYTKKYQGVLGEVGWRVLPPRGCPDGEFVNFDRCFVPNDNVCAYAATTIHSDSARKLKMLTGSDDTITVWLNGKKVLSKNVLRGATKDEDSTEIELVAGENRILVKVCDGGGGWGFFFRITD